jgi:hypothetical protein
LPNRQKEERKRDSRGQEEAVSGDNSTIPLFLPSAHADHSRRGIGLRPTPTTCAHTSGVGAYASLCLSLQANKKMWLQQLGARAESIPGLSGPHFDQVESSQRSVEISYKCRSEKIVTDI